MERKLRVAILMGGPTSEHEISLRSGEMVLKNLNSEKFRSFPVKIEKDGTWPITLEELKDGADVAFIAMHGTYGEDGKIQTILETFKIPYTGSDPIASALAMNKQKTAVLLSQNGLLTPESILVKKEDPYATWAIAKNFALSPLVIKPADQGSSIGITLVTVKNKIKPALREAFNYSDFALAQRFIKGKEVTCGVLEINSVPVPLVPTEIVPKKGLLFNYAAKYEIGGSEELTPPNLPKDLIKKIQMIALKAHKLLGCSGISRTDMILGEDGNIYVLELNTIPGLTETSLLPQQAAAMGIKFPQLLELIIKSAWSQKK